MTDQNTTRREGTRGRVPSGGVQNDPQTVAELDPRLEKLAKIEALLRDFPDADLDELTTGLVKSLKSYPDSVQDYKRSLTYHTQAPPATVRLLREIVKVLCH